MDPSHYKEHTIPFVSPLKDIGWDTRPANLGKKQPNSKKLPKSKTKRRKGPMSLLQGAAKVALNNLALSDDAYLHDLPANCKAAILKQQQQNHKDSSPMSLKAWKFFKTFLKEDGGSSGGSLPDVFHHSIPVPTADDFTIYTRPLQSNSTFQFVAHIRIAGTNSLRSHDLIHLTSLTNLGILEIFEPVWEGLPFPRISDRLVRSWSEEKDPFPSLKILRVVSLSLTARSLAYLTKFDQLCLFEANGEYHEWRRGKSLARRLGWVHCDKYEAETNFPEYRRRGGDAQDDSSDGGAMLALPVTHLLKVAWSMFEPRGPLGRFDWVYWMYNNILHHTTPLSPLHLLGESDETRLLLERMEAPPPTTELAHPVATLSLGEDALAVLGPEHPYLRGLPSPWPQKVCFWRYWLPDDDGGDGDGDGDGKTSPLRNSAATAEVITFSPRAGYTRRPRPQPKPPKKTKEEAEEDKEKPTPQPKRPMKDTAVSKTKRRRREQGNDYLRDLLGDSGRGGGGGASAGKNNP